MSEKAWPWLFESAQRPWCIAHRGASQRAFDNSLEAFELASASGADFWEVDVRTTRDGYLVAYHDASLLKLGLPELVIAELTCQEFTQACESAGQAMLQFQQVVEQAIHHGCGLYVDAKDRNALKSVSAAMNRNALQRAIITSFDRKALFELSRCSCLYPRSVLVRLGDDPVMCALDAGAQLAHLCWEWAEVSASELRASGLFERAEQHGIALVLWHEERIPVLKQLCSLPVRGICTNEPELFKQLYGQL